MLTGIFSIRRRLMPMVIVVIELGQDPHAPCSLRSHAMPRGAVASGGGGWLPSHGRALASRVLAAVPCGTHGPERGGGAAPQHDHRPVNLDKFNVASVGHQVRAHLRQGRASAWRLRAG